MAAFVEFLEQQRTSLPRLPVPALAQTLKTYLRSVQPFLSDSELRATEALVAEFGVAGGVGEKLQTFLEQRAANSENWLSEWWLNVAYLDLRAPLPVNSSIGLVYPRQTFGSVRDQLASAAALTAGLLDFKALWEAGKYPPERLGPFELDMSQFGRIFGVCRIPGQPRDSLKVSDPANLANHIVVAHNNHFFQVPVYGAGGELLSQSQLVEQLTEVVAQSPRPSPTPVGLLTSEHRDTWARAYQQLRQDPGNAASLDLLERGLFVVCLDGPPSRLEREASSPTNAAAIKVMVGGDAEHNAANRWFEHAAQFIVAPGGEVGLTCEHSPGEVHPAVTDHMETYWTKFGGKADPVPPAAKVTQPHRLTFTLTSDLQDTVKAAERNMNQLAEQLEIHHFVYAGYGKDVIKSMQLGSPDSFIQMAIQLAFYRLHGQPGAQYESATTRRFLHGRTETIRSCSLQSVAFARTMLDPAASPRDKAGALAVAMKGHREYVVQAVSGEGVDRHLLGLRLAAAELGLDVPPLFLDAGYLRSGHMRLSTSQVPTISTSCGFFAPLVPDGYGCCYNPRPHEIIFATSALRPCAETSAVRFCGALEASLDEMKDVFLKVAAQLK